MKTYELTYIVSSELAREEAEITAKEIESFIQKNEGVVLKRENPVAKTLSYPIKSLCSGYFNVLDFQINPEKLNELKKKIEKEPKIIRHMLITKNPERKLKTRRGEKKFKFDLESEALKIETSNKEEFSFASPFASVLAENSENQKNIEDESKDKKAKKYNSGNKKNTDDVSEKIELKNIEEKLDEILGE